MKDDFLTRRMPAEWEHQSMVQLTWPHKDTDWASTYDDIVETMTEMAIAIAENQKLLVVSQIKRQTIAHLKKAMTEKQFCNTTIVACRTNDTWARDHGFITVFEYPHAVSPNDPSIAEQHIHKVKLLDFKFNGWGNKFEANFDNHINSRIYETGAVKGEYENHDDFILEGGSIESDGKGTIFTTANCLLAKNRNKHLTKEQIEEQLKKRLGATRIVWFNHGSLKGDDTDGHIDTLVRCAPNETLIYASHKKADKQNIKEISKLYHEIHKIRNTYGRPFKLVSLPFPEPITDNEGNQLPATYINYLVINKAVIVPIYGQPINDKEACDVLARIYPEREIIPIDARPIIKQHGSVHCLTMQYY